MYTDIDVDTTYILSLSMPFVVIDIFDLFFPTHGKEKVNIPMMWENQMHLMLFAQLCAH